MYFCLRGNDLEVEEIKKTVRQGADYQYGGESR